MKTNPSKEAALTINSTGIGTVTRKMVRERATELALINGRSAKDVSATDWEQAKRELTGEPDTDPKEVLLESAPESERWDPLPGSTGHIVPVTSIDGEDDDGRSMGEKLIDEVVQEAENDQCSKPLVPTRKRISAKIEYFESALVRRNQYRALHDDRFVARRLGIRSKLSPAVGLDPIATRSQQIYPHFHEARPAKEHSPGKRKTN